MRFKMQSLILLAFASYITYLGLTEQLNLYIHPRYIDFTKILTLVGLVLTVIAIQFEKGEGHRHSPNMLTLFPMLLVLVLAIILPPQALTAATVSQRVTDSGSIVVTGGAKPVSSLFLGSSKGLSIVDWQRLISANSEPSYYKNKPAQISGFIYDAELGGDVVWLARFVVTCCAVDAQPVGIPVKIEDWHSSYKENDWLQVEGEFSLSPTAQGDQLVLNPTNITAIERPSNPYANQ